jgi:exodeoxyribonuclease V alpha subunit
VGGGSTDKVSPRDGADLTDRSVRELHDLGYRDSAPALPQAITRTGELDRDAAVETVLSRLGARRSGWNAADIRGEAERLIARSEVVAEAAARLELAEDLTARAIAASVRLVSRRACLSTSGRRRRGRCSKSRPISRSGWLPDPAANQVGRRS